MHFIYNLHSHLFYISYLIMFFVISVCIYIVCYLMLVYLCSRSNYLISLLHWFAVTHQFHRFCCAAVSYDIVYSRFKQLSLPVVAVSYFNCFIIIHVLFFITTLLIYSYVRMCFTTLLIYTYYICLALHLFVFICFYNFFLMLYSCYIFNRLLIFIKYVF